MTNLCTVQEEEDSIGIEWDKPFYQQEGQRFVPRIFETAYNGEPVPEGFNAVTVQLNGRADSTLKWQQEMEIAEAYASRGLALFWKLDLGLFEHLEQPLDNQAQMLSLRLAVDELVRQIERFRDRTIGISVYEGPFPIDLDYIDHLTINVPYNLQKYLLLDVSGYSCAPLILLTSRERFHHLHLAMKHPSVPQSDLSWRSGTTSCGYIARGHVTVQPLPVVAVCVPPHEMHGQADLSSIVDSLLRDNIPFRLIPEPFLTSEWDGLDYVLVDSHNISNQGFRMLQGFCAAGGTVITHGALLGLPYEMPFAEWQAIGYKHILDECKE